jgi:hypothetical protein
MGQQLYQHNGVPAAALDMALLLVSIRIESNFSRESQSKNKLSEALPLFYPD